MPSCERSEMRCLAERIAIHVEKGELALAHRLIDRARLAECVQPRPRGSRLAMQLTETTLPPRLVNLLQSRGIFTLADLMRRKPKDLLSIPRLSAGSMIEIYQMLESLGYRRGEPVAA